MPLLNVPTHPKELSVKARLLFTGLLLAAAACSGDDNGTGPTPTPTVPTAPQNVVVQPQSSTTAQITFATVTGAATYDIERVQGATGGTFAKVGDVTVSPFNDTGLLPGTTYRYRVRGVSTAGAGAYSAEITNTTLAAGRTVVSVSGDITTNTTWVADNVYRLQGFRKVASGATLTIQAGTRIEGDFNTVGSSLFVLRGARIVAIGTAQFPIVLTSSRAVGTRQPGDWGGLIIVGNARINRGPPTNLEGTGTDATQNPLIDYAGGTVDTDNSGELRYVRVEFAGFGPAQDAELNSFTFAAVGSGTQFNWLQSMSGLDDSFEWFGGTADAKFLVSYEAGDDHFDMSEGFSGRLQNLIAYQSRILTPRAGAGNVSSDPQGIENDGCNGASCGTGQDSQPFTVPLVANFTLVGFPSTVTTPAGGARGVVLRRGTGGYYYNGLIARNNVSGLSIRDVATGTRAAAGLLDVKNHLLLETPAIYDASTNVTYDAAANSIILGGVTTTSVLTTLPTAPTSGASFDWTPVAGTLPTSGGLATFTGNALTRGGTVVTGTTYRGAADPAGAKWWANWTNYALN